MKRMTPSPGPVLSPSVRLLAEFIVIILGVLIALAADTWRESRQQGARRDSRVARCPSGNPCQ